MLLSVSDVRITLKIDEGLLRLVDADASRTGRDRSEVVEQALRRQLGLDVLQRLWQTGDLPETAATELALEAQHATRQQP